MEKCSCYQIQSEKRYKYDQYTGNPTPYTVDKGICFGTKGRDECSCGGDRSKCNFYPEIREKAKNEEEMVSGIPVDIGFLYDWYISSVSSDDPPVWTKEHIDELFADFYLIPKDE